MEKILTQLILTNFILHSGLTVHLEDAGENVTCDGSHN